jgi:hypothetical protein
MVVCTGVAVVAVWPVVMMVMLGGCGPEIPPATGDADEVVDTDVGGDAEVRVDADEPTDSEPDVEVEAEAEPDIEPPLPCDQPGEWPDPTTGLCWQRTPAPMALYPDESDHLYPAEAEEYCSSLAHGPWRLPTIGELRSFVEGCPGVDLGSACAVGDGCLGLACIDGCVDCEMVAGPGVGGNYWSQEVLGTGGAFLSSDSCPDVDNSVWAIDFRWAGPRPWSATHSFHTRCVR